MPPAYDQSPLMKAVRLEQTDRVPIWLMRQAGRYLPEYRAVRRETTFLDLCKNPRLCADVMIATVERLGVDAAILFSDLLLILEAMGLNLEFTAGDGPKLHNPVRHVGDVDRLLELTSMDRLEFVVEAVRQTRAGLREELPLIGFAGAPFTLAAYAVEGGSSRDYRFTKTLMYTDPGAWDALAGRLARAVTLYLNAQIDAGAQVVQLFDSWVGCLGVDDYRHYVLPHSRSVIEAVARRAPVVHFATGNPALLPLLAEAGGNVIGVDWRVRLDDAWRAVGYDRAIQGNLDPTVLLSTPAEVRRRAREVLQQAGSRPGHIFNLGHGVLTHTPVENVLALIDAVHEWRASTTTTASSTCVE
jgi:uroporphyrinogen decarboxylase